MLSGIILRVVAFERKILEFDLTI